MKPPSLELNADLRVSPLTLLPLTGQVRLERLELELPGAFPLPFARAWCSPAPTSAHRLPGVSRPELLPIDEQLFGPGWSHPFAATLTRDVDGYTFLMPDGLCVTFDDPHDTLSRGEGSILNPGAFMRLTRRQELLIVHQWFPLRPREADAPRLEVSRQAPRGPVEGPATDLSAAPPADLPGQRQRLWCFRARPFAEASRLVQLENGMGMAWVAVRDRTGQLQELRQPQERRRILLERREDGRVAQLRIGTAHGEPILWTRYRYDQSGRLSLVTQPDNTTFTYQWDERHHLLEEVDPLGQSLRLSWDEAGRCVQRQIPGFGLRQTAYEPSTRTTHDSASTGAEHVWSYTPEGRLSRLQLPSLHQLQFQYDAHGRCTEQRDEDGIPQRFQYDANGDLAAMTLGESPSDAPRWQWQYDSEHRPLREVRPDGSLILHQYDEAGRLIGRQEPGGKTRYLWDERGFVTQTTLPDGRQHHTLLSADGLCREQGGDQPPRREILDPLGRILEIHRGDCRWQTTYDGKGRRSSCQHPDGTTERWERDALGRITLYHDRYGSTWRQSWESRAPDPGWQVTLTTPLRYRWRYQLTARLQTEALMLPNETLLLSQRTPYGALQSLTLPSARPEQWQRAGLERTTRRLRPDGQVLRYRHNQLGQVSERLRPSGMRDTFEFDTSGWLLQASAPEVTLKQTIEYAEHTTQETITPRTMRGHPPLTVTQTTDPAGRLRRLTVPDTDLEPLSLHWDKRGRLQRVEHGAHPLEEWTWDDQDRPLTRCCYWESAPTSATQVHLAGTEAEADPTKRTSIDTRSETAQAPAVADASARQGIEIQWEYGHEAQPKRVKVMDLSTRTMLFDRRFRWQAERWVEQHDLSLGTLRLDYNRSGQGVSLRQHPPGRSGSEPPSETVHQYVYDGLGRPVRTPEGPWTYGAGLFPAQLGDTRLEWDAAGRLIARTDGLGTTRWCYDVLDRLLTHQAPDGRLTRYSWDPRDRLLFRERLPLPGQTTRAQVRRYLWRDQTLIGLVEAEQSTALLWAGDLFLSVCVRPAAEKAPPAASEPSWPPPPRREVYLFGPGGELLATFARHPDTGAPCLTGSGWWDPLGRLLWTPTPAAVGSPTPPHPLVWSQQGVLEDVSGLLMTPHGCWDASLGIQTTEVWSGLLSDTDRP